MDQTTRVAAAESLLEAYASRVPVAPLVATYPGLDVTDAYEIQRLQIERFVAQGRVVKGHKVGLTAVAVQRQLGVDQPDFGHLMDDFFYAEHAPIPLDRFVQPRIEPEIGFVLKSALRGPGVTAAEALQAIDFVLPSLEIVDSRIADWKISIVDTIADNASSGAAVLGSTPTRIDDIDLRLVGCVFRKNGQILATGAGGAVLGSPLNSLVWLANTLGALGVELAAGEVILPGSVTPFFPVAAGDIVTATFGGLGSVTARFVAGTDAPAGMPASAPASAQADRPGTPSTTGATATPQTDPSARKET